MKLASYVADGQGMLRRGDGRRGRHPERPAPVMRACAAALAADGLAGLREAAKDARPDHRARGHPLPAGHSRSGQDPLCRAELLDPCRRDGAAAPRPCRRSSRASPTRWSASGGNIVRPKSSICELFDFEGELAVVIGRPAVTCAAARSRYVVGYSIFLDASSATSRHPRRRPARTFAAGQFGPWLVTADEAPDSTTSGAPQTRLNGQVVQEASTFSADPADIPRIIEYCSGVHAAGSRATSSPRARRLGSA